MGDQLEKLVYRFFFAFSRLEFSLKESGYYRKDRFGGSEPNWQQFQKKYEKSYLADDSVRELFKNPPRKQIVNSRNNLDWEDLKFGSKDSELRKAISVVKTVRNNLFHGGKHGDKSWDDPKRVRFFLKRSITCLDCFSKLDASVQAHYRNEY